MVGNALEWYDFAIYGYFAATIGFKFFPSDDPAASIIASFSVFAVGFVARPVGAVLFGNLGDRMGRRRALIVSILVMAGPTTLIGVLPTYDDIGVWAPVILIALRLLQGLSVGGEMTGAITLTVEAARATRRGVTGSWSYFGVGVGFLLGSGAGSLVTGLLDAAAVADWGWRIPFLCGAVIALCGYVIRRQALSESYQPPDIDVPWYKGPPREAITSHGRQMIQAIGISAFSAGGFYLTFVYLTTYITRVVGDPKADAFDINTINMVVYTGLVVVGGLLGDRFGIRWVLLVTTVAGLIVAWPMFWLIDHRDPVLSFLGQFGLVLFIAPFSGVFATTMALLFPPNVRMSGFSISYNVGLAALGGTTPLIASYLISRDAGDMAPAYVLIVCAVITIATIIWAWRDLPVRASNDMSASR